ncbi:hypothetical protein Tco_0770129 [Tanacetum coccineum]|uniref:Transmembrane protein n=1 Tax=Tanacetum coccineum TaxID=301880 RepID=A0ABQ4ZBC8_9ASTR
MILGQPVHTDDNVETTVFNWHEIDFERHEKQLSLVVDYFQWLAFCFGSSWLNGPPSVVGVGVTVVVIVVGIVVVVESSSVVKLSFVVGRMHSTRTRHRQSRVLVGLVFLLGLLAFAIVAACASRAAVTLSTTNFQMAA